MRRKQWIVLKSDKDLAATAAQELGADPLSALIITSRNFTSVEAIGDFLDNREPLSLDPFTIKDMDKAAARINKAIESFEMICVFGDYDADGVTATALLYSYLESRGANVTRYIPDRISEGYGLNKSAIDVLSSRGVKLIVTVDNGVSAIEETAYAYSLGMEVVITDHHKTGDTLPECEAVVNPHRPDCPSTFKEMSGVGVAFKLACAIEGEDEEALLDEYADLIAIGTIGDVVSLTGENRVMVKRGINNINYSPGLGVSALIESAGVRDKKISSLTVAYTLCPRINAAGRMGSADKALDLLLCDDAESAELIAQEISQMNSKRQQTETEIFKHALSYIYNNPGIQNDKIIVVDGEDWHQGVIGIVAARLTEKFGRPSVVISRNGDTAKGSARSIDGFSIYDAIESTADLLTHYGGHTLAAGIGLNSSDIPAFRKAINEYAAGSKIPFAKQYIDCKLQLSSIGLDLLPSIEALEPFGCGNQQPCFGLFGVKIEEISGVSEGKHTRFIVSKNNSRVHAVCFNYPEKRFSFEIGDTVDLAVNLERNTYGGETRVSVIVRGIRPAVTDEEKVLESISAYNEFRFGSSVSRDVAESILPERNIQVDVFKSIKSAPLKDADCEQLCVRLGDDGSNLGKYLNCVDIMTEMGILTEDENGAICVPESLQKANLEDSVIMKNLRKCVN